jgi:hypothetical protein
MGDEDKDNEYQIWLDEYANISIADTITVSGSDIDVKWESWASQIESSANLSNITIDPFYHPTDSFGANDIKNDIKLTGGGQEMLRIAEDGFYVNGVKVKQGKREAKAVYEAFKKWMTHAIMSGELNDN